jgi:hypothetical protein
MRARERREREREIERASTFAHWSRQEVRIARVCVGGGSVRVDCSTYVMHTGGKKCVGEAGWVGACTHSWIARQFSSKLQVCLGACTHSCIAGQTG